MGELVPASTSAVVPLDAPPAVDAGRNAAMLVYGAYLASFAFPPLIIGGLIAAYMSRERSPAWLASHFTLQIRTFWLYFLYLAISIALCLVFIGLILIPLVLGWFAVRQVVGLGRVMNGEAQPRPTSWI